MDPEKVKAALDAIESGDAEAAKEILKDMVAAAASGGEMPEEGGEAEEGAALEQAPADEPEEEAEMSELSATVLTALGRESTRGAAAEAQRLIKLGLEFEASRAKIEGNRRRELTARLVELGTETPATAWEGDPEQRKPAEHLRALSIDALEKRVKAFEAAKKPANKPPTSAGDDAPTQEELALIKKYNMNEAQAAVFVANRRKAGAKK